MCGTQGTEGRIMGERRGKLREVEIDCQGEEVKPKEKDIGESWILRKR